MRATCISGILGNTPLCQCLQISLSLSEQNRQYVKTGGANASQAATGGLNMAAMTQGQWHVLVWYLWMKSFDSSPAPLASFGFIQQCPSIILLQP